MARPDRSALIAAGSIPGLLDGLRHEVTGRSVLLDLRGVGPVPTDVSAALGALPLVVLAVSDPADPADTIADVVVATEEEALAVAGAVADHPTAATALAMLLRGGATRTVADGIIAESATYSCLQAGAEFRAWLAGRTPAPARAEPDEPVRVARDGTTLTISLHRPHVHNAFNAALRDALLDALAIAEADPDLDVVLRGDGPSFSSGGDLTEFGTATDPAAAHLVRVARSAGRAVAGLAARTTAVVHGRCIGAGIELPAFAGRVVAHPDATFTLPEVGFGLVPGAGGTVSVPRRIGRQRTNRWAITGETVDAPTALAWGLVDELLPGP